MRLRYVMPERPVDVSLERPVGDRICADEMVWEWTSHDDRATICLIQERVQQECEGIFKSLGVCGGSGRVLIFQYSNNSWIFDHESTWIN